MNTSSGIHGIPCAGHVWSWSIDASGQRTSGFTTPNRSSPTTADANLSAASSDRTIHPDDRCRVQRFISRQLADQNSYSLEYRLKGTDQHPVRVLESGSPRYDASENFLGFAVHCVVLPESNPSQFRDAENELRQDERLALLSHELRNPLTAILQSIDVANQTIEIPSDLQKIWQILERQSRHLGKILDDLLDAARFTHDKLKLELEEIDLREIVADAVDMAQIGSATDSYEMTFIDPGQPLPILGNSNRIRQAIANLLENAAKYTPKHGSVTVQLTQHDTHAELSIRDSGQGIAANDLKHIFEPFFQVARPGASSSNGLGIGLYLVKQIMAEHGGSIEAFSDGPGHGSKFVMTLPVAH